MFSLFHPFFFNGRWVFFGIQFLIPLKSSNCDEIQYKPVLRGAGQLYLPFTVVALVILLIAFCCIRRCCRKRRPKDAKKGLKGAVDLKSVQLLGNAYKEKVFDSIRFNSMRELNLFDYFLGSAGYG